MAIEIIDGQEYKRCSKCRELKEVSEFRKDKKIKDGYNSWCKKCYIISHQKWRNENRKHLINYQGQQRKKNKEKIKEYMKEYLEKNKNHIQQRRKEYYKKYSKNNKNKIKEKNKIYYVKNKESIRERIKTYMDNHKEETTKQRQEYRKNCIVYINNKEISINTAPEELKPLLKIAIDSRNLIRETKNKLKGDIQHGQNINVKSC